MCAHCEDPISAERIARARRWGHRVTYCSDSHANASRRARYYARHREAILTALRSRRSA